jgi:hypothetical protein
MNLAPSVTFRVGQPVPWPYAPNQLAQVEELLRTNVVIVYRTRTGRLRRPRVPAHHLASLVARDRDAGGVNHSPLLPIENPLGRGARKREKTFPPPPKKKETLQRSESTCPSHLIAATTRLRSGCAA